MEQYRVMGMSCAACSARVEKAVTKIAGVKSCSVSLLTNSMGVEGTASEKEIILAVEKAGYKAIRKENINKISEKEKKEDSLKDSETPVLIRRFAVSLIFLLILMYFSMGYTMWNLPLPTFFNNNYIAIGLLQLLVCAVIMVINQKFFINGFKGLLHKSPNMDTLVSLGSGVSFLYSTYMLFTMTDTRIYADVVNMKECMHEFYFESAAMILVLITLGKMLEAHSKGKTTDALKSLIKLTPKTAVILKDGAELEVAAEDVKKGDIFIVRPGEYIPADGIIIEGDSAVNEAALTGESVPVDKTKGDNVSAATLNQSGFIKCEAVKVGEDTTLSQIIKMVSDASATKAPISKAADKVSGIFVPTVIIIAVITTVVWLVLGEALGFALARGISVLVISCPCALGLATPVAIMVGNGIGARNGILFKTAVSLEKTGKAEIVALDKTGTITEGEPKVTDIIPAVGTDKSRLLKLAYSLEKKSEHPLSKAVLKKAEEEGILSEEVSEFKAFPGNGLSGILAGDTLSGGSLKFINNIANIPSDMKEKAEEFAEHGKTPLFFAVNKEFVGVIAVADTIKEDTPKAVAQLKNMGIDVVMLTGDNEKTARAIAGSAGIDKVIAGVLPDGKENIIRDLQKKGRVIMVGDGINDAPALTRADIGIAIGAGTDVAIDSADVVLMKNRLSDVPAAIRLSRAALKNIYENLFWAFIYNIIGIPLAAGVWINLFGWKLNPMFGAAAMSLSSFCVVTNALRLNFINIHSVKKDKRIKQKKEKKIMEKTLKIEGMMCEHCEARVKKCLESLAQVDVADVSHKEGRAIVKLNGDISDDILKKTIEDQGYKVLD